MSLLPIIDAIEKNQKNRLKLLLDLGNDPNGIQDSDFWKWDKNIPLVCAFKNNRWEFAIILLDAGADPNLLLKYMVCDKNKNTRPFKWYLLLFEYGADSNYNESMEYRPLHYLAINNKVELFDLFIQYGADINAGDWANNTPLAVALRSRSTEVANYLIDKGCSLYVENDSKETPLYQAVSFNAYDALCYALTKKIDINHLDTKGRTAIFGLSKKDGFDLKSMAELLIEHGARFDYTDHNGTNKLAALLVINNKPRTLGFLISKGLVIREQDVINKNISILHYAILKKHFNVAEVFIDHKVQINTTDKDGNTALHLCIELRLTEIAEKLINAGASLNIKNNLKRNALQSAFSAGNYEIFSMIFSHPGNTYIPDYQELKTWMNHFIDYDLGDILKAILEKFPVLKDYLDSDLLFECINSGFKRHSVIKILVESGVNINIVDELGMTPLSYAVYRKSFRICKLLIECGANINHRNNYGITPLTEAAKRNYPEIVKLLLESGAKTGFMDWESKTALDHARENKNDELVTLIEQYTNS
jgi:ankyrin repeat protein